MKKRLKGKSIFVVLLFSPSRQTSIYPSSSIVRIALPQHQHRPAFRYYSVFTGSFWQRRWWQEEQT